MWTRDEMSLWLTLTLIAVLGGLVSYYRKITNGVMQHAIWRLAGELVTSAFAGLSAAMLLADVDASLGWKAAIVGIVGHMGSRALDIFEDVVRTVLMSAANVERRRSTPDRNSPSADRDDTD